VAREVGLDDDGGGGGAEEASSWWFGGVAVLPVAESCGSILCLRRNKELLEASYGRFGESGIVQQL